MIGYTHTNGYICNDCKVLPWDVCNEECEGNLDNPRDRPYVLEYLDNHQLDLKLDVEEAIDNNHNW